ncbi:glutamate receptor 3-like [Amphibalanus amphitrite]|uniref:glutamate receptor 3-like n=1 Tax=Amphibalanus amphitrite TaxID=1232801 RepID=UPI001C906EC4|nr:glutamate receptor 3-like [Amphibalanus amphitrite]
MTTQSDIHTLATFMTLVSQGWASTPRSLSGRTVTLSSWVLGMLIYFNYTANLISHLTVTTVGRPISSLREFSEQPGWLFSIEPGMGVLNDMAVTGRGHIRLDVATTARRSLQPRVLTYIDVRRMFFALGSDACALVPLLDQLPRKSNDYMVMAKGRTELLDAINRVMQVLNQAGTVSRLKRKWLNAGQGLCTVSSAFKEMSLEDVTAVLFIVPLAAGYDYEYAN